MRYAFMAALLAVAPLAAHMDHSNTAEQKQQHREIKGNELKSWYDQKKPMIVLDARSKAYFDGTLLPNARWLPSDSSDDAIKAAIPTKGSLIVVYCAGVECPASGWLYDKLIGLGYTNIYEYHEGLEDWLERGYPTTKK